MPCHAGISDVSYFLESRAGGGDGGVAKMLESMRGRSGVKSDVFLMIVVVVATETHAQA